MEIRGVRSSSVNKFYSKKRKKIASADAFRGSM